jgi:hypothetical protein
MRSLFLGALLLGLCLASGPAVAGSKLEARIDAAGRVYYVTGQARTSSGTVAPVKGVYWGSNPQTAQPLRDGQRVNVCPKRPRK